jgi:hypothetical protein
MQAVKDTGSDRATPSMILEEMQRALPTADTWNPSWLAIRKDGTKSHSTDLECATRSLAGAMHCALAFCARGEKAWGPGFPAKVEAYLTAAAGRDYAEFDNDPKTTFDAVKGVIHAALTNARRDEQAL